MEQAPWAIAPYAGGVLAVQANDTEVLAVRLLDASEANALTERTLQRAGALAREALAVVQRELERPTGNVCLPLGLYGTRLQVQVWRRLRAIPVGCVLTYAELAGSVGLDNGCRAVANACARNKLAVLVPCHRVVRSDGGLGGYAWGLPRKQALLAAEAQIKKTACTRANPVHAVHD